MQLAAQHTVTQSLIDQSSTMASLGETGRGGGRTVPGETLQGVTPDGKNFWANL